MRRAAQTLPLPAAKETEAPRRPPRSLSPDPAAPLSRGPPSLPRSRTAPARFLPLPQQARLTRPERNALPEGEGGGGGGGRLRSGIAAPGRRCRGGRFLPGGGPTPLSLLLPPERRRRSRCRRARARAREAKSALGTGRAGAAEHRPSRPRGLDAAGEGGPGRAACSVRGRARAAGQAWGPRPRGGFQSLGGGGSRAAPAPGPSRPGDVGGRWPARALPPPSRTAVAEARDRDPPLGRWPWALTPRARRGRASAGRRPGSGLDPGCPRRRLPRDAGCRASTRGPLTPGSSSAPGASLSRRETGRGVGASCGPFPLMLGVDAAAVSRANARTVPDSCRSLCFRTS